MLLALPGLGVLRLRLRRGMAPSPGFWLRGAAFLVQTLCSVGWSCNAPSHTALPPALGRRARQALTARLNLDLELLAARDLPAWDPLLPWLARPRVRWQRPRRRPFHQQRRKWSGWPSRGCRIGEARNPGPAPGTRLMLPWCLRQGAGALAPIALCPLAPVPIPAARVVGPPWPACRLMWTATLLEPCKAKSLQPGWPSKGGCAASFVG